MSKKNKIKIVIPSGHYSDRLKLSKKYLEYAKDLAKNNNLKDPYILHSKGADKLSDYDTSTKQPK